MNNIILLVIITAIISLMATPLVIKLAIKLNAIDVPNDPRRIHKKPTPRMGGVAIYIAFVIGVVLNMSNFSIQDLGLLIGATVIVIGGMIDDVKDLRPRYKLVFQIVAAVILIVFGLKITLVTNPLNSGGSFLNLGLLGIPLTIIWVIGITNAFNLIDGVDGLAAGVGFISSVTLFIVSVINGRGDAAFLTAILSGAIIGFLPYNFNPARIFMGDTGSQLLGFLLAAISIDGAIKSATALVIAVPLLALGLPIYDTLFAMIRRKVNGKPIMQADKGHLHHRLLGLGLTQRQVVLIMYLISAILGGIAIIAMQISSKKAYFLLASVVTFIAFIAWELGLFDGEQ
ncbi:MAG: undecaprenyl/decaprenyl-phosphate alpha-N-acetylglucosaminyl 1-phosphate transferase [Clostridium argentinense]|uniref:Undecaprenyl/decaprenyl-phosphate alpha-N-acetylglucosaminyl 1-phosphate transferase n=1 Tax=Clostridium faecium TaxID=2762223 RepID=A0ABR8YTP4_9CLOT|nr:MULTISPECIES: MraY family glycosyltransferase [Clostridium]MBD8047625.1 undecaprenyl/decaprenyl-phosphate alpha-N-acetylglucosaminyl 1-phosphate transferase [Clostridium faecium]MBS5823262.1 undecaprenyl/decaprenyl-phosphate alpha-N-acetylglucosaminyl 1-phosphate transferase [Clostridium argentinense]MDU1349644.1 MraY family glycosyltransferase [Clostridium argentinense]